MYVLVPTIEVETAGLHVPVIGGTFVELWGKRGAGAFWQTGCKGVKVGVTFGSTLTEIVCGEEQILFGVKV